MADSARMLDAWIRRMAAANVLRVDEAEAKEQLSGWLELFDRAALGEAWAEAELSRLVAFSARNHGAEGRTASSAMTQLLLLEDCLQDAGRAAETAPLTRRLIRIAVDAHEAGASQRLANKNRQRLTSTSPVLRFEQGIVGFLIGEMHSDLLDALFGRVLRESVRMGTKTIVIDCAGAEPDDELFHRTVEGLQSQPPGDELTLVLTGLRDIEQTREGLKRSGADLARIRFEEEVSPVLLELLRAK